MGRRLAQMLELLAKCIWGWGIFKGYRNPKPGQSNLRTSAGVGASIRPAYNTCDALHQSGDYEGSERWFSVGRSNPKAHQQPEVPIYVLSAVTNSVTFF